LSGSCVQRSVTVGPVDDAAAMGIALEEAAAGLVHGDVPIGAVVLVGGAVVARRHNERERSGDPTAHAELLAVRDAARVIGNGWRLERATVVVTVEPCAMCAGSLIAARVDRLVFGAHDPKGGACGSLYNLCVDPRLTHEVSVAHGVRADEARALLDRFFAGLRADDRRDS
jgi:tRNA(adenine34) deaminase